MYWLDSFALRIDMKKVTKKKWIAALKSGDFKQGKGQLRHRDNYCCLGVLCVITGNSKNRGMTDIFPKMGEGTLSMEFMGLSVKQQDKLATLNDQGKTFKYIASYIKRYVKTED